METHVSAYLEKGTIAAAIVGPILNIAEDLAAGREVTMRAGDYIALQTFVRSQHYKWTRTETAGRELNYDARVQTWEESMGFESFPYVIGWELTLACNLRCRHCASSAGSPRGQELTLEESLAICDQFPALLVNEVIFTGGTLY